jgi:hypothetical protein
MVRFRLFSGKPQNRRGGILVKSPYQRWPRTFSRFRNSGNVEVWSDRIRDRHIVSVQVARPGLSPPGQSQRAKRVLGAGTKSLSECFRAGNDWNYWNGWNHWNRLLLVCQSDGGPQSRGQTENSFRQSQTIRRDLKHHSLPKRHSSFSEARTKVLVRRLIKRRGRR